jgi:hypothetical protein
MDNLLSSWGNRLRTGTEMKQDKASSPTSLLGKVANQEVREEKDPPRRSEKRKISLHTHTHTHIKEGKDLPRRY